MSRRPLLLCAALVLSACAQPPTNPGPPAPGELEFFGHLPRSTQSLAPLPIPDVTGNGAAMKAVCCRGSNFSLTNPLPQAFDLVNGVTPGSPPPTSLKTPSWTVAQGIDWSDGSGDNGIGGPNLDLTKLFAGGAQTKWAAMFAGYLRIDPSGSALTSKAFAVASDDGIRLVVSNGTTTVKTECNQGRGIGTDCINFSGNHPTIMDVSFPGTGGLFPFGLLYFQGTGGQGLELRWANGLSSGNPTYTVIPGTSMYAPDLRATLTVEDVNGGTVQPNDVLRYTVTITNVGTLADQQHVFAFKPPANLSAPTVVSTVGTWGTSGGIYGATGMPGLAPGQSQTTIFTAAVAGGAKSGDTVDVQGAVLALVAPLEIETALANDAAKTSQGELYVLTDDPTAGSAFNGTDIGNAPAAFATSQAAGLADDDPTRVTVGAAPVGPPVITGPANPSKSDTLLAVSGTSGQPNGQVVQVYLSGASFSATYSATVNAGAWSATPVALHDGTYTAQAQYQDVSGNLGALSSVYTFVVQSPPKPVITQPADGSTVTNASVLIGGTSSEPDGQVVKVTVTTTGGTAAGTCNATIAGGTWGCSLTLADGSYKAIAQVVEITSDLGSASDKVGFVVSTVSTCDTSLDPTRTPINDDTPAFTGTANPGDGVRVCEGGSGACASGSTTLCSTTASGTGAWTCTPGTALGQGAHLVVAVSQAATSTQVCTSANDAFVVDTVAPAAPTFDAPATPTAVRTPHFTGKGEPGATVHVTDGHGNELCSATVDPNGD
ncbi:MAG: hypothetical protein JST92_21700, partial [Deltaproteobacteria bacterium]|nr:hypothetical protein [Deltaproteobacteria bacterium]